MKIEIFFLTIINASVIISIVGSFRNNHVPMLKYASLRSTLKLLTGIKRTLLFQQNAALHTSFENNEYHRLIQHAAAWCGLHGLMYTDGKFTWKSAPVSLIPNLFPSKAFQYSASIQPFINQLMDVISRDRVFLNNQLQYAASSDEFVRKLLDIYNTIPEDDLKEGIQIGIHRSDYMVDRSSYDSSKQIEINTIASSFGCLSKRVGEFQSFMLKRYSGAPVFESFLKQTWVNCSTILAFPEANPSMERLAYAIAMGHSIYNKSNSTMKDVRRSYNTATANTCSDDANSPIVLFVVQQGEKNQADQRLLELQLRNAHNISVEFRTLAELHSSSMVDEAGRLWLRSSREEEGKGEGSSNKLVSLVYYRAGYTPADYPTEIEWEVRALLEKSSALKCPSVGYQLAGSKIIQAALSEPGVLESFCNRWSDEGHNAESIALLLRRSFVQQYKLGGNDLQREHAQAAIRAAEEDGSRWVLKPQREGGGNNLYGTELSAFLRENKDSPTLGGYVLMERIFPSLQNTAFLRNGEIEIHPSISELGIYGTFIGSGLGLGCDSSSGLQKKREGVLLNEYAGYLLRTKPDGVDEGGVATGYSVLNSIVLTDTQADSK